MNSISSWLHKLLSRDSKTKAKKKKKTEKISGYQDLRRREQNKNILAIDSILKEFKGRSRLSFLN